MISCDGAVGRNGPGPGIDDRIGAKNDRAVRGKSDIIIHRGQIAVNGGGPVSCATRARCIIILRSQCINGALQNDISRCPARNTAAGCQDTKVVNIRPARIGERAERRIAGPIITGRQIKRQVVRSGR